MPHKPRSGKLWEVAPKEVLRPLHDAAVLTLIPKVNALLQSGRHGPVSDDVVVLYHDGKRVPEYGLMTLNKERWMPPAGSGITRDELLMPLREADRLYRDKGHMPPDTFMAFDVPRQQMWHGHSFHKRPKGPVLDATTGSPLPVILGGPPVRLPSKAQVFQPAHVPTLVRDLSAPGDRPEEAFLLHEELLHLAVDSLDADEQLDPLPVHKNGLWVFARPVIMRRPDGTERHVRAVWYREGDVMWRMRTFAAGVGNEPKEVGERLAGRLPFVPVWDENRAEQKLIAAIWALMAQGDVTETEGRRSPQEPGSSDPERKDLTIVRVKAGTGHAKVYRHDDPSFQLDRPAWSVRGHWRHQPYPSLGRDEKGRVITKMKWIASYTKGDVNVGISSDEKVISVRL